MRDSRLQASDAAEPLRPAHDDRVAEHRTQVERKVEVHCTHRTDVVARQHADHVARNSVDPHVPSQDCFVAAEETRPAAIGQHDGRRCVGCEDPTGQRRQSAQRVFTAEDASAGGRDTERVEEIVLDPRHARHLRTTVASEYRVDGDVHESGETRQRPLTFPDVADRTGAQRSAL